MKPAVKRPRSAWRQALGLVLACALAACGPGVGGSGTGAVDNPLLAFGATAKPVCSSTLAPQLASCGKGPAEQYADNPAQARVTARIEDSLIELQAHCAGLKFSGEWAAVGTQAPRFYGTVTSTSGTALASLTITPLGAEGLRIELRDMLDVPLLDPLTLKPTTVDAVIATCP